MRQDLNRGDISVKMYEIHKKKEEIQCLKNNEIQERSVRLRKLLVRTFKVSMILAVN